MIAVTGKKRWYTVFGERTLQVYVLHAIIFVFLFAYPGVLRGYLGDSFVRQLSLIPIAFILTAALSNKGVKQVFDKVSACFRVSSKKPAADYANEEK